MVSSPTDGPAAPSSEAGGDTVIAQYLAAKVSWWATYPRILIVTPSTLSTYNPETFQCTNQWEIADIEAVELTAGSNQFVLRLEKSRFRRSAKLRFTCGARGHFLSLLSRLRRQAHSLSLCYQLSSTRRLYYRCYEQFANASHKQLLLQVTVSSIIFLDEVGRRVQTLPFLYLHKVAFSANHNEGLVLCTAFHERFFLCAERHECLNEIVTAAKAAGVELYKCASPLTVRQLRQHNRETVDRPSIIRFDVKKARHTSGNGDAAPGSEGSNEGFKKAFKQIQLILQAEAIVEMHRSLRTVIARPYSALLAIVRPDWDPRTLVLEFKQEDTLVLDVDGRDQLVTLLLLVCREAGQHHVILTSSGLNYCRFYHPHAADSGFHEPVVAGDSMATFLLCRITQTDNRPDETGSSKGRGRSGSLWSSLGRGGGPFSPRTPRGSESSRTNRANSGSSSTGGWFQRRIKDMRPIESLYETRNSIDSGLSMNDNVNIGIAMEEFNANLPLDELARSGPADAVVLNQAMELVLEHLVTLVAALRRYGDASSSELVTTLQALVRLYHHPDAYFTDDVIPRVFDAVHELILQQDTLTCYWCLRLLQCILGVGTSNTKASNNGNAAGDQRASMIQHFVQQRKLQNAIVDLLPASFAASTSSSFVCDSSIIGTAFWTPEPEMAQDMRYSSLSSSQSSILCTKDARVQNEINVVFYETLLTLHHALIHLRRAEKDQLIARDRNRYMAGGKHQQSKKSKKGGDKGGESDDDEVPAAKQKEALAGKLLEKYRFLMDSIVDVRLVRMAETSVALVQFVLNHYTDHGCDRPRRIPSDKQLIGGSDLSSVDNFYDTRTRRLGALASFLDDFRAVTKCRAAQGRSFFFGSGKTIEMPLEAFSNATRSETTTTMLERMLEPGSSQREYTVVSNGSMRIEYLDPSEPSTTCQEPMTPPSDPTTSPHMPTSPPHQPTSPHHKPNTGLFVPRKAVERASSYDTYDGRDPSSNQFRHGSPLRPRKNALGQNSLMRFDSENMDSNGNTNGDDGESGDTFSPMLHSDHIPSSAKREAFRGKASEGARRTAHECDACIGCNDVCSNERCFFCAEKEYQLHAAFAGSSVAAGPSVRQAAWQHRVPSVESSFNVEREYSSCEMRRHQTKRSCWIRVDGSVYDVTDMLGVHPGGAKVLLDAAQHGGDCGPIMKTHPPAALDMLAPCRLGRFYECEKSTLLS